MKWRVAEIFGPTIQGEGRQAGLPCYFIRFGGCDLRCVWCDTPHAVLPDQVARLPKLSISDIYDHLAELSAGPEWVVISGGNPALLILDDLVSDLHARGYKVMVETQGTVFHDWLCSTDELCVSPKPPSSQNLVSVSQLSKFVSRIAPRSSYLKVVVFDDLDYLYAQKIHTAFPDFEFFVSAGNADPLLPTVGNPYPDRDSLAYVELEATRDVVARKFRWLAEKISHDPLMDDVRVLPQLHTIAWGNERGR